MLEVIKNRRSVREFSEKEISDEVLSSLCEAGFMAPTARNQGSAAFIIVKNKDVLNKLSEVSPGARVLKNCNRAIVIYCPSVSGLLTKGMVLEDLGAVAENILLEATSLGLGSCWIGIAPNEERMARAKEILNLGEDEFVFNFIALGYPKEDTQLYFKESKIKPELIKFI